MMPYEDVYGVESSDVDYEAIDASQTLDMLNVSDFDYGPVELYDYKITYCLNERENLPLIFGVHSSKKGIIFGSLYVGLAFLCGMCSSG
jgi:hypothetical protein